MLNKLKKMKIQAMKDKDVITKNIISIVIANVQEMAKNDGQRDVVDADVLVSLKSLIKKNNNVIEISEKNGRDATQLISENVIMQSLLPSVLSEVDTKLLIDGIIDKMDKYDRVKKNMRFIIGEVKNANSNVDMKLVSSYIASNLT
jgi:uncharacterized protein YqeY